MPYGTRGPGLTDPDARPLGTFPGGLGGAAAQLDSYPGFARRRAEGPVVHDPERGCHDVFDYEGAREVLASHDRFPSDPTTHPDSSAEDAGVNGRSILYQDPPRHDELRSVVDDFIRSGPIGELTPDVEALAGELLEDIVVRNGASRGGFDLVREFAVPLPVTVIPGLLGVPTEDHVRFREWSMAIVAPADPGEGTVRSVSADASAEMEAYFDDLLATRREVPREDLLSRRAATGDLSGKERFGFAILPSAAGHLTTTNLIATAGWSFAEADRLDDVGAGAVDLERAIEESLRYRSPVQGLHRWTTEPVALGDRALPASTSVLVWLNAANRDPVAFDDAGVFDPTRRPNRHLSSGHGIHSSLGASLARPEGRVALASLLERVEELEPRLDRLEASGSVMVYGPASLPVRHRVT